MIESNKYKTEKNEDAILNSEKYISESIHSFR
jgi:hypothetical protein